MKIDLCFAELQTPLFLAGTNHGVKLDITKRPLRLVYDRTEKELLVIFNGKVAILPTPNVASMTPIDPSALELGEKQPEMIKTPPTQAMRGRPPKAQVSDPVRDVVFGPGK